MTKFILSLTILLGYSVAAGQPVNEIKQKNNEKDSIRSYSIGQIVKSADDNAEVKLLSTSNILKYRQIQKSDGTSIAETAPLIPSSRIETNSRGETLIYLRNSGERQTALFFDGALLNVPWDNRMDISFIPSDIIGSMVTAKGSSSVLYGPNTMGGAVSLSSFERYSDGQTNIIKGMGIEGGGYLFSGTSHNRSDETNIIVHYNSLHSPGVLAPDNPEYELFNRETNSGLIPNSFQDRNTGYIRGETKIAGIKLGLGVMGINGSRGVQPQDNREKSTRYWKYDDWTRTLAILNADYSFGSNSFRTTLWADGFEQEIAKFNSIDYDSLGGTQNDSDHTYGGRAILDIAIADGVLSSSLLGYHSVHDWDETGQADLRFSQTTFSVASEYRSSLSIFDYVVGGSYDINITPETGQFTADEGNTITDFGFVAGLGYDLNDESRLFANISRKNRFPTLREQYSDAGRFIINPDLEPENGILSELGFINSFGSHSLTITAFYNMYDNLIEVEPVIGDSLGRDIRKNIDSAVIPGVELEAVGDFEGVETSYLANLSVMQPRGVDKNGEERLLETRPELIGFLRIENTSISGLSLMPEFQFNGSQLSFNGEESEMIGFQYKLNLRLAYKTLIGNSVTEVFTRLDNITDEPFLFKIGFPAAGRTFRVGVKSLL